MWKGFTIMWSPNKLAIRQGSFQFYKLRLKTMQQELRDRKASPQRLRIIQLQFLTAVAARKTSICNTEKVLQLLSLFLFLDGQKLHF